jgi:hypothetical protein
MRMVLNMVVSLRLTGPNAIRRWEQTSRRWLLDDFADTRLGFVCCEARTTVRASRTGDIGPPAGAPFRGAAKPTKHFPALA